MRTKTLLLTAALGIASVATSMAQAVYSVNIVGYVNLTMRQGHNLVANQLDATPNNHLSSVFPTAATDSQVNIFTGTGFVRYDFDPSIGWYDAATLDPAPPSATVGPGQGFYFYHPGPGSATVTTVGGVRTGNGLSVPITVNGFSLISAITPQDLTLNAANSFPVVTETQVITQNSTTLQLNDPSEFDASVGWFNRVTLDPVPDPSVTVGQGFFVFQPSGGPAAWVRNFNPNTP